MPKRLAGPSRGGTSVNDPRIYSELRAFRERHGLPGDVVARELGWSPSKISRIERGMSGVTRLALHQLVKHYSTRGMTQDRIEGLLAMFEETAAMTGYVNPWLGSSVLAASVRTWAPYMVPRVLQVPGYAMGVLSLMAFAANMPPAEAEEAALAIAQWQGRLTGDPPVRLRAVLDEGVLYRQAGSREDMCGQLRYLDSLSGLDGADTQVRVLSRCAAAPRWTEAFSYLEFPVAAGIRAPATIVTEDLEGPAHPDPDDMRAWKRLTLFEQLWEAADEPGAPVKRALESWA
jgi:Domain of unknown function (DUF5753)/Helix-turn-helix domain